MLIAEETRVWYGEVDRFFGTILPILPAELVLEARIHPNPLRQGRLDWGLGILQVFNLEEPITNRMGGAYLRVFTCMLNGYPICAQFA